MADKSEILETFWGLASLEESERLAAAQKLLTTLVETQADCAPGECGGALEYCAKRLVRGLASGRKAARHGYFIAFTELLSLFPSLSLGAVLELVADSLEPTGGDVKATEARGMYFGQVFALLAIIKSGRLVDKEDVLRVVGQLCACAEKKAFLGQFCAVSVDPLLDQLLRDDDITRDHVISLLGLERPAEEYTPETLYFALLLSHAHSEAEWLRRVLKRSWHHRSIMSPANFSTMAAILLASSTAHPHLHCVWPPLLAAVRQSHHLGLFWRTVVDESFFASSHERRCLGFKLLEHVLPDVTPTEAVQVLSPSLLRCLVNNASSTGNYLHLAARHLLTELSSRLSSAEPELAITVYVHLNRRVRGFDRLTHSTLTEDVLASLDTRGTAMLMTHLQELFCSPRPEEEEDGHAVQSWALEEMLIITRSGRGQRNWAWLLESSKFLLFHAFFTASKPHPLLPQLPEAPLERSIRENCVQKFNSVLADLSNLALPPAADKESGGRRRCQPGVMEDGRPYLSVLLLLAQDLLQQADSCCSLSTPFSEQEAMTWGKAVDLVKTLSLQDSLSSAERALMLLLSASALQMLPHTDTASNNTEELCVCYAELQRASTVTPRKSRRCPASQPPPPQSRGGWMEVLTDLLLSFLATPPSQLWRGVAQQAFRLVAGCTTAESLELILHVLEPKQGREELMEEGGEGGEGGEDGEGGEASEDDSSEASSSEDGGASEGGEGGDGVDPAFRAEVRKALGTAAPNSDQEESASSLDDEAMTAVDAALAAAFRSRMAATQLNRRKKDEAKSMLHFKLRALDLIEIFVRKEPTNPLVLDLVVPLYKLVQSCHGKPGSAPLLSRASALYRSKLCRPKEYPRTGVDAGKVHLHIAQLFQCMYKAPSQLVPLTSLGVLFLIRVLVGNQATPTISPLATRSARKRKLKEPKQTHGLLDVAVVTECFAQALHDFITKKNTCVHQGLFCSYCERQPELAWLLVGGATKELPASAGLFRKVQVYEILEKLFASKPADAALLPEVVSAVQSQCLADIAMATKLTKPVKLARAMVKMLLKLARSCDQPLVDGRGLEDALTTLTASHPTLSSDLGCDLARLMKELNETKSATPTKRRRRK